jgi:cyclic pyranopterin phosphate synthase
MSKLTHLDESGSARMVDVSEKSDTARQATAEAIIALSEEAYAAALSGNAKKGDVLGAARIAGIMAAKKTSELIPLCHPLALTNAAIDFEPLEDRHAIRVIATAKTTGPTGVEMEALTAASIAALTIYDMIKAVDHAAQIEGVRLLAKSGGKSGDFKAAATEEKPSIAARLAKARAKPAMLMSEVAAPRRQAAGARREAFRAFMTGRGLRASAWAKEAGVPAALIYSYLTGKSAGIPNDAASKLAQAAKVRVEDMFAHDVR